MNAFRSRPHGDIDPFLELRHMQSRRRTPDLNEANWLFSDLFSVIHHIQSETFRVFSGPTPAYNEPNRLLSEVARLVSQSEMTVLSGRTPDLNEANWLFSDLFSVIHYIQSETFRVFSGPTPAYNEAVNETNRLLSEVARLKASLEADRPKKTEVAMADDDNKSGFRQTMMEQLERWAQNNPDEEVAGSADVGEPLTRRDLYNHVRHNTSLGAQLMKSWEELAVEYVRGASLEN